MSPKNERTNIKSAPPKAWKINEITNIAKLAEVTPSKKPAFKVNMNTKMNHKAINTKGIKDPPVESLINCIAPNQVPFIASISVTLTIYDTFKTALIIANPIIIAKIVTNKPPSHVGMGNHASIF